MTDTDSIHVDGDETNADLLALADKAAKHAARAKAEAAYWEDLGDWLLKRVAPKSKGQA